MIIKKTLPRYSDDEVTVFHPLFERACIEAIDDLGLSSEIKVEHHKSFGGLTVDFAIERIVTSRVVLLVEIKRTPSAVKSTRNRHQALSYRKEADSISETPYYVLTNLEITELFKYDPHRPRPSSQIISESPFYAGLMSASCFGDFYNNLIAIIKRIIDITLGDAGEYKNNSEELHQKLKACVNDKNNWHKVFMAASYEYIRGAASRHADLSKRISNNGWKPADQYLSDPSRLSSKGALIDFDKIFCGPLPEPNHPEAFDPRYLNELYNAGISSTDGEDIVEAVNNVLGPSEPGIVETDVELARLLSIISG